MFRVNGATFIGRWYRVLVVLANMLFGLLAGLQPLLPLLIRQRASRTPRRRRRRLD